MQLQISPWRNNRKRYSILYWGSVRFFKHLILSTVALMIIIPTVLAIVFGVQNSRNKQLAEELKKYSSESQLPKMEYLTGVDYTDVITVSSFPYQETYPDMYVERSEFVEEEGDRPVIYLTFDVAVKLFSNIFCPFNNSAKSHLMKLNAR